MRNRLLLAAAVSAGVLAATPPAFAKAPPRGKYGCTIESVGFGGNLHILAKNRYRVDSSKVGKFRHKGRKMRFPSGAYKGLYRGKWHKTDDGRVEIELTSIESGRTLTYCILEKRA